MQEGNCMTIIMCIQIFHHMMVSSWQNFSSLLVLLSAKLCWKSSHALHTV